METEGLLTLAGKMPLGPVQDESETQFPDIWIPANYAWCMKGACHMYIFVIFSPRLEFECHLRLPLILLNLFRRDTASLPSRGMICIFGK